MRDVQVLVPPRPAKTAAKRWRGMAQRANAVPRAWHLLSLDAPTVAATWCSAFMLAAGVSRHSGALRCPVLFLSLATWLCYVGDRVLDARSSLATDSLRPRHFFYGELWRTRRPALLGVVGLAVLACLAIALRGLSASLLVGFSGLTGASLLYFARVHSGAAATATPLAKEGAVGLVFAVGCMLPAWTVGRAELRPSLAVAGVLFAMLCWLNCVAIERWEGLSPSSHPSTRWAAQHLGRLLLAGAVAAAALGLSHAARTSRAFGMLAPCLAAAFMLLALLEGLRQHLSREALRVLADVVLLTPLLCWAVAAVSS